MCFIGLRFTCLNCDIFKRRHINGTSLTIVAHHKKLRQGYACFVSSLHAAISQFDTVGNCVEYYIYKCLPVYQAAQKTITMCNFIWHLRHQLMCADRCEETRVTSECDHRYTRCWNERKSNSLHVTHTTHSQLPINGTKYFLYAWALNCAALFFFQFTFPSKIITIILRGVFSSSSVCRAVCTFKRARAFPFRNF